MSNRPAISVRLNEHQKDAIEAMCASIGVAPATLAKQCLLSALSYYEEHKDVPMPPAIVRQSEAAQIEKAKIHHLEPKARETA
jgi:hypothetical protein